MTAPQQTAAKTENARDSGTMGLTSASEFVGGAAFARGRKEATTREQTYSTIYKHD
jgi:hypothetical protein